MQAFEFNKETKYLCIDPLHLAAGLQAAQGNYANIHVRPMDLRSKNLAVDLELLSGCTLDQEADPTSRHSDFQG